MHVLISVVGKRTEHWVGLFGALVDRPDIELTVYAADVSALADHELTDLARHCDRVRYHLAPHLLGEDHSGHMASVLFRPGHARTLCIPRPDVVHIIGEAAYLSTQQTIRLRNRRWPGVPITLYAAQNVVMRFPLPFPLLERHAFRTVDHAFPITPSALHVLRTKGYRNAASIVPLGVDTERFRPDPTAAPDEFTVGFVGRLEPHKGIADLLAAAGRADADLLVVGDGSLRGMVEREMAERPGRVRLHRWVGHTQLPALLAGMHVLVLPSIEIVQRNLVPWIGIPLREQFGRVLVEAMACGIPVVGSDSGDIPHVVGTSGLVFPAGDVRALEDRLLQIRENPTLAVNLGDDGRRRACAEFSWHGIADTLIGHWRRLVARQPAARPPTAGGGPPCSGTTRASTGGCG